jgi:hypothetical protein
MSLPKPLSLLIAALIASLTPSLAFADDPKPDASTTTNPQQTEPPTVFVHAGIRGGGTAVWTESTSSVNPDSTIGYGFGLHISPLFRLSEGFALGPLLTVTSFNHETDAWKTNVHLPAIGLLARISLAGQWRLNLDLDYVFGKGTTTPITTGGLGGAAAGGASGATAPKGGSSDLHGAQLGAELVYHWPISETDIGLDLGVNASYVLTAETDTADSPLLQGLSLCLTIKALRAF